MSILFDATYYMDARPDVLAAFVNSGAETGTGLTWPAFAQQHYNNFGWKEGYNPNPIFNTNEYLTANEDVLNAGVNPFEHYLTHGVNEGRAPNASFPKFADFDADAYLAANSDLGEAGIETAEEAYAHFVMHGQFENRPGAPVVDTNPGETQNLTVGVDAIVGTSNNDTFNAVPVNPADSAKATTLNAWDSIDGGDGVDTLNIYTDDANFNTTQQGTVKNVEIINVYNKENATFGGDAIDASKFEGSEQIWQNNFATGVSNVAATQTVGIRDTAKNTGDSAYVITAAAAATALSVALDEAGAGEDAEVALNLQGAKLSTVNISGTVGEDGGKLSFVDLAAGIKNVNLALDSDTDLALYAGAVDAFAGIETINGSASTGDLTVHLHNEDAFSEGLALETVATGSGDDFVSVSLANLSADAVSFDLGGGADEIILSGDADDDGVAVEVTLGAGADIIRIATGNVRADEDGDVTLDSLASSMISITDFNGSEDLLDFGYPSFLLTPANAVKAALSGSSVEDLVDAIGAIVGHGDFTGAAVFDFGGNTYLYVDANEYEEEEDFFFGDRELSAGDALIEFVGGVTLTGDNVSWGDSLI